MRILGRAYLEVGRPGQVVSADKFGELFKRVDVDSDYFTVERFRPGTAGEASLRRFFGEEIFGDVYDKD